MSRSGLRRKASDDAGFSDTSHNAQNVDKNGKVKCALKSDFRALESDLRVVKSFINPGFFNPKSWFTRLKSHLRLLKSHLKK